MLLARRAPVVQTDLSDGRVIAEAFAGCDGVAHCAGINREIGTQTYQRVHIDGTRNVIDAARNAGVKRILLLSFLRARPGCGSAYHESKFAAEEMVRGSGLDYTVLKAGMIYGRGDHMLDHLSHTLFTMPLFATVGFRERPIRPVAVREMTRIIMAALTEGRLSRATVAVLGPETLLLSEAARRVARAIHRRVWIVPAPVWFHRGLSMVCERTMRVPLVARAQVQMLAEGFLEAAPFADELPEDLRPRLPFTEEQIMAGLPESGPFRLTDLACSC